MSPRNGSLAAGLVLLFSALLAAESPPADSAFAPWFHERQVRVEIAGEDSPIPWVRGVAELPAPVRAIGAVIRSFDDYAEIFSPAVRRAHILERRADGVRMHLIWPYPFPFRDRDAIITYRWERLPGGGMRLAWRDDARPGDPSTGIRIERVAGETLVEPLSPERSRVTYTYLADFGGRFPRRLLERAQGAEPVAYVAALRRALGIAHPPP